MKPLKTKAQTRKELNEQINAFLGQGGGIEDVPRGISGNHDNSSLFAQSGEPLPRQERTPLTDVVKAMDERKQQKGSSGSGEGSGRSGRRRKVLITDDFGEPVRWVWQDD